MSDEPKESWELRLYVAGQTPRSLQAFANLKKICEEHLKGQYTIEVVDLVDNPQLARGDQILAIPTLVRKLPPPMRKIIGDLSDTERVLVGLDLRTRDLAPEQLYVLQLYVTGMTKNSLRAIENIKRVCRDRLNGRYQLEVIDIYQNPDLARKEQILAAPTLIKKLPVPLRRFVGDLSDQERILAGLNIRPIPPDQWDDEDDEQ